MNEIKVSFNKIQFIKKPSQAETALLSTLVAENSININKENVGNFVRLVGEKGCTFCPATFNKGTVRK